MPKIKGPKKLTARLYVYVEPKNLKFLDTERRRLSKDGSPKVSRSEFINSFLGGRREQRSAATRVAK